MAIYKAIIDTFSLRKNPQRGFFLLGNARSSPAATPCPLAFPSRSKASIIALIITFIFLLSPKISLAEENIFETSFNSIKQSVQDIQEKIGNFFSEVKQEKQGQLTQEIQNKLEQAQESIISHLKNALWRGIKDFWRGSIKTGIAIARYFIDFIRDFLGKIFKDII